MVGAPKYVLYLNTPPHTRAHSARSVDGQRRWIFYFKWGVVEIWIRNLLSCWLWYHVAFGWVGSLIWYQKPTWQEITSLNINHPSFKVEYSAPIRTHTFSPMGSHLRGRARVYNISWGFIHQFKLLVNLVPWQIRMKYKSWNERTQSESYIKKIRINFKF